MGLPPVFKTKRSTNVAYITLLLSDSNIQAALWKIVDQEIVIISQSSLHEYADDKQAVVKADQALQDLGKDSEKVNDVIFGLPHTWVNGQGIVDSKKPLLKMITEDLGLKAVGFVVASEAIAKYLIADNPRWSMLLIEFNQHELYLSFINQGKLLITKFVGRSGDTIADMAEALARINAHLEEEIKLPGKMFVTSLDLDEAELKEQQQLLLSHDWLNSHPFIHSPTVDILDQKIILESVIKQGGGRATGTPITPAKKEAAPPSPASAVNDKSADLAIEVDAKQTQATNYGIPMQLDDLDHQKTPAEIQPQADVDLLETTKINKKTSSKTMNFWHWFKEHRTFAIVGFMAGLLALGVVVIFWLNTAVKAVVELTLNTELISKEATITLDPTISSSSIDNLVLAADTVEQVATGKKTIETTGVKVVGDQATGKITLYNKTDAVKTFDQGTELSKGDLLFTLDEDVEVASASTEELSGGSNTEYGSAEAAVTATEIGSDSNLDKETDLQVASFDPGTYSATVLEGFSGGSSREVRVVSTGDKEQLVKELKDRLFKETRAEIEDNLEAGSFIASSSIYKVDKQALDAEVGDEIGAVTLELSIVVQALVYKTADLKPLAQKVLEAEVAPGYTIANSEPQILSAPDQEASDSGTISLLVNISSESKPDLDMDSLKENIIGKRISEAERTLALDDGIESAQVNLVPSIAAKLYSHLPKDPAKIEIK